MLRQQTFFYIYEPNISIYDTNDSQWPFYCLTFKCDLHLQFAWVNVSNEQLSQIILKSMHKCRSYGPDKLNLWPFYQLTFKCELELQVWAWPSTYLNNCFKWHFYFSRRTTVSNYFEIYAKSQGLDKPNWWPFYIIWPSSVTLTFNLPEKSFKWHFCLTDRTIWQNCFEIHA